MRTPRARHCERSEAIHGPYHRCDNWIASSLPLLPMARFSTQATWFETAPGRLLTMRSQAGAYSPLLVLLGPHPEEHRFRRCVSKDGVSRNSAFPRHYRTRVIATTSSLEKQRAQGKPDA